MEMAGSIEMSAHTYQTKQHKNLRTVILMVNAKLKSHKL